MDIGIPFQATNQPAAQPRSPAATAPTRRAKLAFHEHLIRVMILGLAAAYAYILIG